MTADPQGWRRSSSSTSRIVPANVGSAIHEVAEEDQGVVRPLGQFLQLTKQPLQFASLTV